MRGVTDHHLTTSDINLYGFLLEEVADLAEALKAGGVKVVDIHDLKAMAEKLTGVPRKVQHGTREVAKVIYRDGTQIDSIRCVK